MELEIKKTNLPLVMDLEIKEKIKILKILEKNLCL